MTRECTKCELIKPATDFPRKRGAYGTRCKTCQAAAMREYRSNNRDLVNARAVEYRRANPEAYKHWFPEFMKGGNR